LKCKVNVDSNLLHWKIPLIYMHEYSELNICSVLFLCSLSSDYIAMNDWVIND